MPETIQRQPETSIQTTPTTPVTPTNPATPTKAPAERASRKAPPPTDAGRVDPAAREAARRRAQLEQQIEATTPVCPTCWVAASLTGMCSICGEPVEGQLPAAPV